MDKPDTSAGAPKGVVDPRGAAQRLRLATYPPSPALAPFVECYWVVQWDMQGRSPEMQRVLPYPNAHLVFDQGKSAIHGVVRGAFDRTVSGAGRVLGVRFHAGGLRPFIDQPLSAFADRTIPLDAALKSGAQDAERRVLGAPDDAGMVAVVESMLVRSLPAPDPQATLAREFVAAAAVTHGPVNVAELCARTSMSERSLQRLFGNYVGASPKWVIQRYRLQEAMAHLGSADTPDLAGLAQALGFFDQAHLTRDFTALVGHAPMAYWRSQQR
ncbi:MAG: helix-turn-helix domain-containing protein [Pseudomonadota bacterium]|nr:helix-turn-helix domain-containing protein [Pseudomonadota bacterium]